MAAAMPPSAMTVCALPSSDLHTTPTLAPWASASIAARKPAPPAPMIKTSCSWVSYFSVTIPAHARLEFRLQPGLFAKFVCCYSVYGAMALDRKCLLIIRVNRMLTTLAQQIESVLLEVLDQVPAFYGHAIPRPGFARVRPGPMVSPYSDRDRPGSFRAVHL